MESLTSVGHELGHSLFKWLQTFDLSSTECPKAPNSVIDLADGVAIAHCLAQVDPSFFDSEWIAKLKADVPDNNWRLKLSNLKKVLKGILDFYADVLGQHIQDFHMPDLPVIAERGDIVQTGRLLQLVLGCAVNCDKKQQYIEEIMGMEEAVQHVVMNAIQELMTKETPASPGGEALSAVADQLKRTETELNQTISSRDELLQRCHELDFQVASLREENLHLRSERGKMDSQLNVSDEVEDPTTPIGRKFQQLQRQVETLQESLEVVESHKEDLLIKVDLQARELAETKNKNDELTAVVQETSSLKDELDILRDRAAKAEKMEAAVDTYKRKLEDAADAKRQLKLLEEKNAAYVEQTLGLEEELRKSTALKAQVEAFKRQVQELQLKLGEEIERGDKAEFERARNAEKLSIVEAEKTSLQSERESLKEVVEELTLGQTAVEEADSVDGDLETSTDRMEALSMPPEIRAKFIKLRRENKALRASSNGPRPPSDESVLEREREDALRERLTDAEARGRNDRRKILELSAAAEDAAARATKAEEEAESLRQEVEVAKSVKRVEGSVGSDALERLEAEVEKLKDRSRELTDELRREKESKREMEERYKRYLEKAKTVIKNLDPRKNGTAATGGGGAASADADKQLADKEDQISKLRQENIRIKAIREKEDNMISSAWYSLSAQLAKRGADERLASLAAAPVGPGLLSASGPNPGGNSFLARQRQAHARKLTMSSTGASGGT